MFVVRDDLAQAGATILIDAFHNKIIEEVCIFRGMILVHGQCLSHKYLLLCAIVKSVDILTCVLSVVASSCL